MVEYVVGEITEYSERNISFRKHVINGLTHFPSIGKIKIASQIFISGTIQYFLLLPPDILGSISSHN